MRVVTVVSLGACALFGLGALVVAKTMMPAPGAAKVAAALSWACRWSWPRRR